MFILHEIKHEKESEISKQHGKLESRVDTEVANLQALFERYKADSIKYMAGKNSTIENLILISSMIFNMPWHTLTFL
jgi:hypothetical protein